MKDLLNGYIQHPPYIVEIEPTEGCNLGCSFCGIRGMRKKGTTPWNFMTIKQAADIAKKIRDAGWNSFIVFCGHGEPTLNKNLLNIIKIFRHYLPNNVMQLMNNGYGFRHGIFDIRHFFTELQRIEFNDVLFDVYSPNGDWNAVKEIPDITGELKQIGVNGEKYNYRGKELRVALYPMEIDPKLQLYRRLDNHLGAAAPYDYSEHAINRRCQKPFRHFFIRHNGEAALCCDDFRGVFKIGNVKDYDNINDLWNNEVYQAARIMLYIGKRELRPCYGCNYSPIRAGLIPDPSGKDKDVMPKELSDEAREILRKAFDEKNAPILIRRKWETDEDFINN